MGPVLLLPLPATTAAQQGLWQEHLHVPPNPCSAFGRLWWVAGYFPLPSWRRKLEASTDYSTEHKGLCSGALAPCPQRFDTVQLVPIQGFGPRPLLWASVIPGSVDVSSDLRARGSVLQIEDWQLFSRKENDWLDLFLIHCYLVHMHNSCLILVVISRKYCLSLSQRNSLSRCPLKKKKSLNLEKSQNLSKRKAPRNN